MAVKRFRLSNEGVFLARVRFVYWNGCGKVIYTGYSGYINPGDAGVMYPDEYGVPDGAMCALYADVMNGCFAVASERMIYSPAGSDQSNYSIYGTTAASRLVYDGLSRIGSANTIHRIRNRNCEYFG